MSLPNARIRTRWVLVAVGGLVLAYSWVAAALRPFTLGEEVMVAIPAGLVLIGAWWTSRVAPEPVAVRSPRWSRRIWLALLALAFAWELGAFFSSPRADHPTLSVIADEIMSVHTGRALLFLLWLGLGFLLVVRRRSARR